MILNMAWSRDKSYIREVEVQLLSFQAVVSGGSRRSASRYLIPGKVQVVFLWIGDQVVAKVGLDVFDTKDLTLSEIQPLSSTEYSSHYVDWAAPIP